MAEHDFGNAVVSPINGSRNGFVVKLKKNKKK